MTLTKDRIIDSIYHPTDLPKDRSNEIYRSLIEIIRRTLSSGEDLLISGFGKFVVSEKKERLGRNPQTGDTLMLAPRRVVVFKCSEKLKEKLNATKKRARK